MSEELENEIVDIPDTEENLTVPEQDKNEKRFSQSDVNRLVQDRLKREKAVSKKQAEDFEAEKTNYVEAISKYEEILSKTVEKQLADYPDYVKSLVSKLPILEQIEWLSDEKNKISKKEFPQRKQTEGNLEETPKRKNPTTGI